MLRRNACHAHRQQAHRWKVMPFNCSDLVCSLSMDILAGQETYCIIAFRKGKGYNRGLLHCCTYALVACICRFMAFDRHMNLVLGDAEEFRKLPPKKGRTEEEVRCQAHNLLLDCYRISL